MEMILFLSGLTLGALVSWEFTHAYHKESSAAFNKLSMEVRQAIIEDDREKLSIIELNDLIREKTIDKEIGKETP